MAEKRKKYDSTTQVEIIAQEASFARSKSIAKEHGGRLITLKEVLMDKKLLRKLIGHGFYLGDEPGIEGQPSYTKINHENGKLEIIKERETWEKLHHLEKVMVHPGNKPPYIHIHKNVHWGITVYGDGHESNEAYKDNTASAVVIAHGKAPEDKDETLWTRFKLPGFKTLDEFITSIQTTRLLAPDGNPDPSWRLTLEKSWGEAETRSIVRNGGRRDNGLGMYYRRGGEGVEGQRDGYITHRQEEIDGLIRKESLGAGWEAKKKDITESIDILVALNSKKKEDIDLTRHFVLEDAILLGSLLFLKEHKINYGYNNKEREEDIDRALRRWRVWQKGYGLSVETSYHGYHVYAKKGVVVQKYLSKSGNKLNAVEAKILRISGGDAEAAKILRESIETFHTTSVLDLFLEAGFVGKGVISLYELTGGDMKAIANILAEEIVKQGRKQKLSEIRRSMRET